MVGIVLRDGLCEPNQAFVIAHLGCVWEGLGGVWEGRRRWSHGKVRTSGIESPLGKPRRHQLCAANASFWGSFPSAAVLRDRPAARQIGFFALSKTATSPCGTGSLHRLLRLRASGLFPALQGSGALLYAARCEACGVSPVPR
jgi:hypothetical protein